MFGSHGAGRGIHNDLVVRANEALHVNCFAKLQSCKLASSHVTPDHTVVSV
jgi:hypothetical protein